MGRKKKDRTTSKGITHMISVISKEEHCLLSDYLKKEYKMILPESKIFPRWFFFNLPERDKYIDKKFDPIIRKDIKLEEIE